MATDSATSVFDLLIDPLGDCFNEESARRLLKLRADPLLQKRIDQLADKCGEGTLTTQEREEYTRYVSFGTFVALLKSKARQLLAQSTGE